MLVLVYSTFFMKFLSTLLHSPETLSPRNYKKRWAAMMVFTFVAVLLTIQLLRLHWAPALSDFCTFGESFDCDVVNKSPFAKLLGLPVALWGFVYYVGLLLYLAYSYYKNSYFATRLLRFSLGVGLAFSLYLSYLEAFVIQAWCIYCLGQQFIILLLNGLWQSLPRDSKL